LKTKILVIVMILFFGCRKDDFSPVGNYEKRAVAFAVLDNRMGNQIIKVQSLYPDKDNISLLEKRITNLKVNLSDGNNNFPFRDTIIQGSENFSYFTSGNFNINRGSKYWLTISGDDIPTATSEIITPRAQDITLYYASDKIQLKYSKYSSVKGFLHHYYVEFYIREGNKIIQNYRVEIPSELRIINDGKDTIRIYPALTKENNHIFSYSSLFTELEKYKPEAINRKLVVKRTIATVLSLDYNLYNYVSTVRGFSDPVSVRLDQINYSNIANGYGVFGAVAIDSVIEKIPAFLVQGFGFESE